MELDGASAVFRRCRTVRKAFYTGVKTFTAKIPGKLPGGHQQHRKDRDLSGSRGGPFGRCSVLAPASGPSVPKSIGERERGSVMIVSQGLHEYSQTPPVIFSILVRSSWRSVRDFTRFWIFLRTLCGSADSPGPWAIALKLHTIIIL